MEKMDALGALASGVAHDFNNILTAILSATELVEWQVTPDSPIMPKLHVIYQAVMRARELNRQILSFSRGSEDKHLPFDLSAVVKEAIFLLRNTFPATVAVSTEISSSLWIMGDPNQVHQVVMNLAINALQSMLPAGGTLDLDLVERDLNGSDLPPGLGEGRYAVLSVKDTGCGMDPATLERIFEPFFTTKGVGDGTGLGLSVVHGIVHKHRGTMAVRSEVGRGSAFEVFFPCTAREMTAVEEQPKEDFSGSERILLVDDEEVLGALGKQGLQMLGYRVTVRSDSQEALDEFLRGPQEFDLLITDLSMPGFSGVELTQRIRKARPDLPAILVTGAFQAPPSMEGITLPFDDVLFKPVTIQDMAKSVRKVLSLRPVAKHAADPASPAAEPAATGTFSILLAEDSSVTRALLSSWMVKAGYRVKVARDGQEAWEHYRKAKESGGFSLVLTDIVMPRMDGLELAAKIRQEDPSVPIVILSSSEDTESVKAALHLKVNEFLTKPFESAVLLACLERMSADQASRLKGQRSVETAQAVRMAQRAMEAVPEKDMPIFSISEPLTDAGGDVFRCHRRADGSIFFAIADVAGHSVISSYAVAAYLGMLSNFVGECVHLCPPPAKNARGGMAQHTCSHFGTMRCEPLKHLAQKLNRTIQTGPFSEVPICSLFGLWQPATGRLHLLNAGVPHALWFRRGPTRTAPIVINGTPLGILDEPPMEEKVIFMEPGDRLLLGSDGFFDAASADHAVFEAAAGSIWRDLACTDILTAINLVSEAARVHADGRFADDLLVVALEQPEFPDSPDRFHRTFASAAGEIDHTCDDLSAFLCSHLPASEQAGAQCFDALIAVREALSNAMLHGNAGAADARISVRSHWEGQGRLQVAVTDEGLGFDLDSHEPPDTRHSERGRGVPLIRHFARKVTMTGGELNMTFDFGTPAGDPRA
jgi:signal transduction histidine kinase/CheY-like chemotaxis protein